VDRLRDGKRPFGKVIAIHGTGLLRSTRIVVDTNVLLGPNAQAKPQPAVLVWLAA
jgi:hypothetical protein